MNQIKPLYNPESIVFITSLSACINTLLFISVLGMSILDASVIGVVNFTLILIGITTIAFVIAWFEKQNSSYHQRLYASLEKIELKSVINFPAKMLDRFRQIYDDNEQEWRPNILLFIHFAGDIMVFTTLVYALSYAFISQALLLEFSFQLFVILLSTLVAFVLCCFRSYNYDIQAENRKNLCYKAVDILDRAKLSDEPVQERDLTQYEYNLGIVIASLLAFSSWFGISELIKLQDTHLFSDELLLILQMVQHYVTGYVILVSLGVGFISFRIYCSIKVQSPDWQLINTFINIISTYVVLLISAKRFIFIFATLFSLPISASTIALANFLIPVVASIFSLIHAYAFFTFFRHDRELSICIERMERSYNKSLVDHSNPISSNSSITHDTLLEDYSPESSNNGDDSKFDRSKHGI